MGNIIDKIQISGQSYDVKDSSAATVVELTQQEYDVLPASAKTGNTLFVITDAQAVDITQYWTSAQTQSAITQSTSGKADSSAVEAVNNTLTAHTSDTTIHVTTAQTAAWNAKSDFSGSYNDLTDKPTLFSGSYNDLTDKPTIPSKTSDLTNDSNFATSGYVDTKLSISDFNTYSGTVNTAIGNKANSSDVYTKSQTSGATEIATALSGKQDTLAAGTNITIVDNVISATGGGGGMTEDDELLLATALTDLNDRKIDASEVNLYYQKKGDYVKTSTLNTRLAEYETALDEQNVEEVASFALNDLNDRFGGLRLVKITESEYTALRYKDENTLYIVVADQT